MIRLKDIALKGGVSVMTVSKVLRDAPDISLATKTRIRALAQQMGYTPDAVAQGLRTRTTKLLGLVIPSVADPISARMVLAIEERVFDLGYDLILAQSQNSVEREESILRRLMARRVDGLFVVPVYRHSQMCPVYTELADRKIPTIILGHKPRFAERFINVETDDVRSSQTVTEHLLELGHKQIAFFAGPSVSPASAERFEGYRRALREAKLDVDDRLVFTAGNTIEEGASAVLQMLNEGLKPTALQAASDLSAIGAASMLLRQGWKIPGDIAVAGFGNILMAEYFAAPLTTVRQPKFRLGAAAVEIMQRFLRLESVESRRLEAELIVRASTLPAKN